MLKRKQASEFKVGERFLREAWHMIDEELHTYEVLETFPSTQYVHMTVLDVSQDIQLSITFFADDELDTAPPL